MSRMTETDSRSVLPEPEHYICQNPQCQAGFWGHPDEVFCPNCENNLHPVEKQNINYAMEHGLKSNVLAHIMNGGSWNP